MSPSRRKGKRSIPRTRLRLTSADAQPLGPPGGTASKSALNRLNGSQSKTGPPANNPNGVLCVGRFRRLNYRVPSGDLARQPCHDGPSSPSELGPLLGRMASKTEFNGIGGLRTYTQTRAGSLWHVYQGRPQLSPVLGPFPFRAGWRGRAREVAERGRQMRRLTRGNQPKSARRTRICTCEDIRQYAD
jgi:hypothetical protein